MKKSLLSLLRKKSSKSSKMTNDDAPHATTLFTARVKTPSGAFVNVSSNQEIPGVGGSDISDQSGVSASRGGGFGASGAQ